MRTLHYNIIDFEELDRVLGKLAENLHVKKSEIKSFLYINKRFSTYIKKYNEVYGTTQNRLGLALNSHTYSMSSSLDWKIYDRYGSGRLGNPFNPLYIEKIRKETREAIDACFKGQIDLSVN